MASESDKNTNYFYLNISFLVNLMYWMHYFLYFDM